MSNRKKRKLTLEQKIIALTALPSKEQSRHMDIGYSKKDLLKARNQLLDAVEQANIARLSGNSQGATKIRKLLLEDAKKINKTVEGMKHEKKDFWDRAKDSVGQLINFEKSPIWTSGYKEEEDRDLYADIGLTDIANNAVSAAIKINDDVGAWIDPSYKGPANRSYVQEKVLDPVQPTVLDPIERTVLEPAGGLIRDYRDWNQTLPTTIGAKALTRGAAVIANSGYQTIQGLGAQSLENVSNVLHGEMYKNYRPGGPQTLGGYEKTLLRTDLGTSIDSGANPLLGGQENWGSGILPDQIDSRGGKQQVINANNQFQIYGHAFTPGRALAAVPYEATGRWEALGPESNIYNALSGLTDAAMLIYADPADWGLKGLAAMKRFSRSFDLERGLIEGKGTLNGVLDKPRSEWFKFFNPRTPAEWASSKGGARLIKMIADTDSATEIWRATNGVIPTTGPNGENFLQELAEAKTPEDVQSVLFRAIETGGMEKTAKWKSPGYRLRNLGANSRLFGPPVQNYLANIHPTWVTWDSLEDVLVSFDSFMKSARIPLADTLDEAGEVIVRGRTSILDDLVANYDSGPNRFNVTTAMLESAKASMKRHIIGNRTLSGDAADALEEELSRLLRFATSQSLEERVYSMTSNYEGLHVDGVPMDFSSHAHVYNDMQSVGVQLPSPREMRKITNYLQTDIVARFSKNSSIRNAIGSGLSGVENVLEVFNRVWKTATLAKLSYPIKLIGETQGRMAAGGFANIFSSPMKAFAWIVGNNKQGTVDRLDDLTKRLQSTKTADELLGEAAEYKQLLARRAHLKEQFGPLSQESQDELETLDAWVELLGGEEAVGASLADIEIQAQTGSFGRAKQNRGRGAQDVKGENFENNQNFEASMNQNNAFYSSSNEASEVTLKNYVVLKNEAASGKRPSYKNSKGEPFTPEEVANELTRELIHLSDPLSRKLLTQGEEATVNWLRNDPQGQEMWAEITAGLKVEPEIADDAEWMASYVRSYVERIEETAGGNTTLKNAIRDGHIKTIDSETGEEVYVRLDGSGFRGPSEEGIKAVQEELFDPKTPAPSKIKAEQLVGIGKEDRGAETWRKINGVLYNLYPRQANFYDRSPTYRQAYWRDVVRQAPFMSAAARAEAAAQARNVGLGGSTVSVGRFTFNTGEDLASAIENAPNLTQLAATARLNDEVDNINHVVDEFGQVTSFDTNTGEIVSPGLPGLGDVPTATGTVSPKNQTILDQYDLDLNAYEEAYAAANEDYARRLFQDKTYGPTGSTVDDQNVSEFFDEGAEAMFKDWQQGLIEDSLTAAKPIRMPQAGRAPSRYFSRQQTFKRRLTETEVAAFKEEFAERFRKGDLHRRVLEINKDAAPAPYSPSKFLTPDDAEKAKEWDEYTKGPEEYGPPAPPEDGGSPLPPSPPAAPAGSGGAVATPVSFDEGIADQAKESLLADPASAPERLEPPTLPKKAPGVKAFDWNPKNTIRVWPPTLDKEGGQWITNRTSMFSVTDETRPYLKNPLATSENAATTGTGQPPWNIDGVLDPIKESKNRAALSEGYNPAELGIGKTAFRVVHDPSKARPGWLDQDWVVVDTDAYSRHYENALAQSGGAEPQISIIQRGDKIGQEHTVVVFEVDGKITSVIMPMRHDTQMVDNLLKGAATGSALTNEVTIARTLETHGYYIVGANYTDDAAGAKSFNFDLPRVNSVLVTHASMTGRPIEIEVADLQVISGNISDADFGAQMDELAEEFPNWDISGPRVSTSERRVKGGAKDGTWDVKFKAPQGFKPQGIQTQVGYSEAHAANIAADVAKARAGEPSRFTPITEMLEDEQVSKMILGDGNPRLDELSEDDLWVRNPDNSDLIFDGDYEGINLIEADMTGRNFEGANLWRADMDSANLRNVNFVNADLYGAVLDSALVKGANFKGANLKNVRFYDVDLTQIKGKSLHNFDLSYSDLSEANMNNMNLSGSDFTQAQMSSTNLTGANLQGSSLGEAYAKNADLHDADLQGADMTRANLQGANMRNTNVEGAYFDGANIDGVDFEGSNITQAQIDSAVLDSDEYVDIEYSDPLDYEGGGRYRGQGPKAGPETVNLGWEDENFASLTDPSFPTIFDNDFPSTPTVDSFSPTVSEFGQAPTVRKINPDTRTVDFSERQINTETAAAEKAAKPPAKGDYEIGETVWVHSFGTWYKGEVTGKKKTNLEVFYTTGTGTERTKSYNPEKMDTGLGGPLVRKVDSENPRKTPEPIPELPPAARASSSLAAGDYEVGEQVAVQVNKKWREGKVVSVENGTINVEYADYGLGPKGEPINPKNLAVEPLSPQVNKMALSDYSSPSSDPSTARFNPSRQRAPEPITPLTNDERFEALAQYYAAWVKHGQQRLNKNLGDFEQAVRTNVPVPPTRPKSQMPDFDPIENGTLDSLGETDALGDAIKAELAKNYPPAVPRPSRQQVPQLPPARKYSPEEMEKIYEDWFAGPSAAGPPAPPSGGSPPPPPSGPPPSGGALPPDEPAFREGLSMPQIDAAAHRRAAKVVEDLLYNFSNRSVAADKLRLIMPFAEAYREVLTVWARIIKENPSVLRKGQIGYQELMQPSLLGELSGSPEGEGFFYKDPETGQLMYNIPIVHQLSQAFGPTALREIAGAPEGISFPDQTAPAAGLNIVSQTAGPGFGPIPQAAYAIAFLPGVGASLQLYAPDMLKTNDMAQWFQKQIFPFGEPHSMVEVFENMIPRTLIAAAEAWKIDPKEGGAAISSVMRSLMSTGEYKIASGTPDQQRQEMERLQSDARATTRTILGFGIFAKFATPGGATPRYKGIDNYGRTQYIDSMAKAWRSIKAKHPDDTYAATEEFIEKFGTKNLLMTVAPTTPVKGYLSPTDAAVEWRDKNSIFAERYPDVFGLFGPTETKPFSYRAFATEKAEGRRENLGIRDQLSLAKTYQGNLQLNRWAEKNDIDLDNPSSSEQAQIADKRAEIVEENFVFEEPTSDYRALPNRIKDLEDIAKGTDADNFKAIVGLRKYLEERSSLLEKQIRFGYTGEVVSDSSTFTAERKQLKKWGKYYAYKYPAFKNMWKYLFSKELNA